MQMMLAEQINWHGITWSTDVLSAWASVVGAILTALALLWAIWLASSDARRRRRDERENHVAAVREVWIEQHESFARGGISYGGLQYSVRNFSEQTIQRVAVVDLVAERWDKTLVSWRAEGTDYFEQPGYASGPIRASQTAELPKLLLVWTTPGEDRLLQITAEDGLLSLPTIEFDDAAGRRWRRVGSEQPTRVPPPGRLTRMWRVVRRWPLVKPAYVKYAKHKRVKLEAELAKNYAQQVRILEEAAAPKDED